MQGVRKDVVLLTWLITLMSFMITRSSTAFNVMTFCLLSLVAGIVTPLGLYETFTTTDPRYSSFRYARDGSSFAYGTPARSDLPYNRICSATLYQVPCPFTDTVVIVRQDARWLNASYPYSYDVNIPPVLQRAYSSGTNNSTTISNSFDIEWRRYQLQRHEDYNNGSIYLVGSSRLMESVVLRNSTFAVEGLLVDAFNGGVGFRNHTVPESSVHGVSWSEDHLFIEPETVCIDTNLTIDYQIVEGGKETALFANMSLTDRGGFVNLTREFMRIDVTDTQKNPKLYERAYRAACELYLIRRWQILL
jgi:hypothetical protein